jgi:hypothetical protein
MAQEIHNPFSFRDGDETLSFLIGEIFPSDDPLSRDLFRLLCADADLQALREIEESMSQPGSHSVAQAKFEKRALFLVKLRLSF